MLAIASSTGKATGRELARVKAAARRAIESDNATVLCASDVDQLDDDGWTSYAPLPGPTSGKTRGRAQSSESAYPTP